MIDAGVEAVVEIHERIGGPELRAQLVARDHFAGALQQGLQHLERLAYSFTRMPCLRNSPVRLSSSKTPKR